ncbi:MAG TPA: GtrA family protein [Abditibacterium sp.]|jgi:putative flippase GtrA
MKLPLFARFLIVGATCFSVNLAVLYCSTVLWGWHYLGGMSLSIVIVNTLGFVLNRNWTFSSGHAAFWTELLRYYTVNLGAFALNLALMAVLVSGLGLPTLLASALLAVAMTGANFLLHKNWSFAAR